MSFDIQNDPTNADATPAMCTFGMFGGWSIDDWMTWHSAMKSRYGLARANSTFLTAWRDDGFFSGPPISQRSFSSAFRQYAKDNGFLDALYSGGLADLARPIGAVDDLLVASSNVGSKAAEGVDIFGKITKYLIPVALIGAALLFVWPYLFPAITRAAAVTKTSRKRATV